MGKNRTNKSVIAAAQTPVTPAATSAAPEPAQVPPVSADGVDNTTDTTPAAPATPETGSEQAAAPDVQADTAAPSPDPEGSAPPASSVVDSAGGTVEVTAGDVIQVTVTTDPASDAIAAATDTTQEDLEKQAEGTQPEMPLLDRVISRLAGKISEPHKGYASTSAEVSLSGELAEMNAKLFDAMVAEGVPCSRQGDTLGFLLGELRGSLRRF